MDLPVPDREKLLGPLEHGPGGNGKARPSFRSNYKGLVAPGEAVPFCFALSVCGGAMTYLLLPFEPSLAVCMSLLGMASALVLFVFRNATSALLRTVLILVFGVCLGLFSGKIRVLLNTSAPQQVATDPVLVEGWVSAIEPGRNGVRIRVRTHAIGDLSPEETAKTVRLTHRLDLRVSSGRFVRCWAVLRPPPGPAIPGDYDFQRQAWFEELDAVGYVMGRCRGGVLGLPNDLAAQTQLAIASKRRQLARYTYAVSGDRAGGFAAALVSGDRSYISVADQEALRGAGLAHLLAISGLHLGIVGGLVYLLFRRGLGVVAPLTRRYAIQKPAAIAAILAITAYLILSGASVSTQRAYIMSVIFFSAILVDRPALSLRSFSLAMLLVVLLRPESVFSPGFQMSFAATGVLIAIYEQWSRHRARSEYGVRSQIWFWMQSLALTSIAASVATAPFAFYHFERLAPLGLAANLAAMPVVSLLSVPSAGLAIILAPFGLSEWGLRAFGGSLELVLAISHWASAAGAGFASPVRSMPPLVLVGFTSVLIGFVLFRRWLRWLVCLVMAVGAGALWIGLPIADGYWSPSGEVYLNMESGSQFTRVALAESDALGPLRFEGALEAEGCIDTDCTYELTGGQIVRTLARIPRKSDCPRSSQLVLILVTMSDDRFGAEPSEKAWACPNVLTWQSIQRGGGVRFQFTGDSVDIRHTRKCSVRPWRQCPSDET